MSCRAHLSHPIISILLVIAPLLFCTGCSSSDQAKPSEAAESRTSPDLRQQTLPEAAMTSTSNNAAEKPAAKPEENTAEPSSPAFFSEEVSAVLSSSSPVESGLELRKEMDAVTSRLIEKIPSNADLLELRARFLSMAGDSVAAKELWKQALQIDPKYGYAHQGLGQVAKREGNLEEARQFFQQALETQPENAELIHQLADTQTAMGDTRRALQLLDDFSKRHPESAQTWLLLGNAQLAEKEYEQAEKSYRQVLAAYPDNPRARRGLTTTLVRLGRRDEAKQFMRDSTQDIEVRDQNRSDEEVLRDEMIASANIYYQASLVLASQNEQQASALLAGRATVLDPKNLKAWRLLLNINQHSEPAALVNIGQAMAQANPEEASTYVELGWLQLNAGQPLAATASFEEVLKNNPQEPTAYFGLTTSLLRTPGQSGRALEEAKKLVSLKQNAPHFDLLAQAHAVNGNYTEALAMIEKALAEDPQNAQYQFARQQLINLLGAPK